MAPKKSDGTATKRDRTLTIRVKKDKKTVVRGPSSKTASEQFVSAAGNGILGSVVVIMKIADNPIGVTTMRISSLQSNLLAAIKLRTASSEGDAARMALRQIGLPNGEGAYRANDKAHWEVAFFYGLSADRAGDELMVHPAFGIVGTKASFGVLASDAGRPILEKYIAEKNKKHKKIDPDARAYTIESFRADNCVSIKQVLIGQNNGLRENASELARELCSVLFAVIAKTAVQRVSTKLVAVNPPSLMTFNEKFARWADDRTDVAAPAVGRFTKMIDLLTTLKEVKARDQTGVPNQVVFDVHLQASSAGEIQSWKTACRTRPKENPKPKEGKPTPIRVRASLIVNNLASEHAAVRSAIYAAISQRLETEAAAKNMPKPTPNDTQGLLAHLFFGSTSMKKGSGDDVTTVHVPVGTLIGSTENISGPSLVALYGFLRRYEFTELATRLSDAVASMAQLNDIFATSAGVMKKLESIPISSTTTTSTASKTMPFDSTANAENLRAAANALDAAILMRRRRSPSPGARASADPFGGRPSTSRPSAGVAGFDARPSQGRSSVNAFGDAPTRRTPGFDGPLPPKRPSATAEASATARKPASFEEMFAAAPSRRTPDLPAAPKRPSASKAGFEEPAAASLFDEAAPVTRGSAKSDVPPNPFAGPSGRPRGSANAFGETSAPPRGSGSTKETFGF